MAAGADTKTSQVNAEEFEEYFEPFLKAGKDILHVTLSSGLSGVINSAMIAKESLEERYPDRRILIVDSLGASSRYGLSLYAHITNVCNLNKFCITIPLYFLFISKFQSVRAMIISLFNRRELHIISIIRCHHFMHIVRKF